MVFVLNVIYIFYRNYIAVLKRYLSTCQRTWVQTQDKNEQFKLLEALIVIFFFTSGLMAALKDYLCDAINGFYGLLNLYSEDSV